MAGGGKGGGGAQFVPTQTGTTSAGQQAVFDQLFRGIQGLPSAPVNPNVDFLTSAADRFRDIQSGGLRDTLRNAALAQTINPINSAAVQAGRFGSFPQQAALQQAGATAELAALQPELQAIQQAPALTTALSPEFQRFAGAVGELGNIKNLSQGNFGTQTIRAGGASPSPFTPQQPATLPGQPKQTQRRGKNVAGGDTA
jgi:hypothetical protein